MAVVALLSNLAALVKDVGPVNFVGSLQGGAKGLGLLRGNSREGLRRAGDLVKQASSVPNLLSSPLLDMLLKDLNDYADCPIDNELVELALWRRILMIRDDLENSQLPPVGLVTTRSEKKSTEITPDAFRDFYLATYTNRFGKELTALKEAEESFDEQKLSMLVECMESGVVFFDAVEKDLAKVEALKSERSWMELKKSEPSSISVNLKLEEPKPAKAKKQQEETPKPAKTKKHQEETQEKPVKAKKQPEETQEKPAKAKKQPKEETPKPPTQETPKPVKAGKEEAPEEAEKVKKKKKKEEKQEEVSATPSKEAKKSKREETPAEPATEKKKKKREKQRLYTE